MKLKNVLKVSLFLIVTLSGCSSSSQVPTSPDIPTSIAIPTLTPTVTPLPTPTSSPTPFAGISNQLVAYQEEYFGHIYVSDLEGANRINITKEPKGYNYLIGWSPDGKWLTFSKWNYNPFGTVTYPNTEEIWVSNPDGSEKHYLANCNSDEVHWAPDSSYIILADWSQPEGLPDNYLIYDVPVFEKKVLEEIEVVYGFSPNGFFHSFDFSNEEPIINIMDLEGNIINSYQYSDRLNPVMELCEIDSVYYTASTGIWSWFSDFNRFLEVIFCGTPIYPSDNVVILETTVGDEITSRAFAWSSNRSPFLSISPNGQWILYREWSIENQKCGILDENLKQISEFQCNNPKWSPDGGMLIDFLQLEGAVDSTPVYINPETGEAKQADVLQWLTDLPETAEEGLWGFQPVQ